MGIPKIVVLVDLSSYPVCSSEFKADFSHFAPVKPCWLILPIISLPGGENTSAASQPNASRLHAGAARSRGGPSVLVGQHPYEHLSSRTRVSSHGRH